MSSRIFIDNTLLLPGEILLVDYNLRWPFILSIFLRFKMVLLFALPIFIGTGVTPYASLWAPSKLALIVFVPGVITLWLGRIGFVNCVLSQRLRLRPILYFTVPFTMRLDGDSIAFSEIVFLFQRSSAILTSSVLHSTFVRPPNFLSIPYSHSNTRR